MAKGLSRAINRALLDHLLMTAAYTPPTEIWVALFTTAPNSQGASGVEVSASGYGRIQHDVWHAASAADPAVATNDGDITFAEAGASWGTVVAIGLYTAETVGTMLAWGDCTGVLVNTGDVVKLLDATISVSLTQTA